MTTPLLVGQPPFPAEQRCCPNGCRWNRRRHADCCRRGLVHNVNDTINWRVRGPLPIATAIDDRPIFSVATVVTLADVAAQNPSLETLAVLFRTTRPLAVTPFGVSPTVLADLWLERVRVTGQRVPNGL